MNHVNFDALLLASKPVGYKNNTAFTDTVMQKITHSEILSSAVRKMDVNKKETFMMKLKQLPKLAVVAIALGALVLLSGTAYATYQLLWAKPAVQLTQLTTSTSGREEAILSTKQCGAADTQRYELKKGATITADRIPAIVQAQCELKAINTWAQSAYYSPMGPEGPKNVESYDQTSYRVSMATRLQDKQKDALIFKGNDAYGQKEETFKASSNVKYIVDGKESTLAAINNGDPVVYVVLAKFHYTKTSEGVYEGGSGMPEQTLVAVVKLSMPFEDYDQFAWQSLAERQTCNGNPSENCLVGGASIDLYMGGGGGAISETKIMKQIQGVVTSIDGKTVSLKGSSGKVYRITTPTDVIKEYNEKKATKYYNNQKVIVGSTLSADYVEDESKHSTDVNASYLRFVIELVRKADDVKAY